MTNERNTARRADDAMNRVQTITRGLIIDRWAAYAASG